jgi:hypothetical protein
LPPCFNAAQMFSSSAKAHRAENVSKPTKQRSKEPILRFKLLSIGCEADGTNAAATPRGIQHDTLRAEECCLLARHVT